MTDFLDRLDASVAEGEAALREGSFYQDLAAGQLGREAYADFLWASYHYVRHSTRILALAAARFSSEEEPLFRRFVQHLREETGHDQWLLSDLEALGLDPEHVRRAAPPPLVAGLVAYQYYVVEHVGPLAVFGYIYALEMLGMRLGPDLAALLCAQIDIPREARRFVSGHADADPGHVEQARAVMSGHLTASADQEAVIYNARLTFDLYGRVLGDVVAEVRLRGFAAGGLASGKPDRRTPSASLRRSDGNQPCRS